MKEERRKLVLERGKNERRLVGGFEGGKCMNGGADRTKACFFWVKSTLQTLKEGNPCLCGEDLAHTFLDLHTSKKQTHYEVICLCRSTPRRQK